MLCNGSSDDAYESTSSASLKFVRQSDSESQIRMPAPFLCHLARSSFNATRYTVFKSDLDSGSPCFVPFSVLNTSLSLSVKTDLFCRVVSSKGQHTVVRFRYAQVHSKVICGFRNQKPS